MSIKLNTRKTGLSMFFQPWQEDVINHLASIRPNGDDVKTIQRILEPDITITSSAIYQFLKNCIRNELMFATLKHSQYKDAKVYTLVINENEIVAHLFKKIISRLILELPKEAKEILSSVPDNQDQISNIKLTLIPE